MVVVSDEADRVVYQRRLPNDPVQIRAALAPHREDLVGVVIEATFYGRPGIMHGLSVILRCNAQFLWVPGSASPSANLA